ncbi:TetR/AcrR family transcriptional regulator [Pseudoclavibacter helvolus]|uniref:AcrR family transcriptional regulator n=1 Tax=Pseudoclavibacter helvolus TaxID=255205 RepID=A0A7W4UME5_9MICO|nr:TetR/AcrR family transcriptional regulator [Pseudoclavibacter helvolus]MBB2956532.1 AcrR family transcriptional regulator [Pseudoclavibacter helvolus]
MPATRAETKQMTQSRVIDAAEQLFDRRGFAATSVRAIAEGAGVSVGTVMSVGDKGALLVCVFDRLIERAHEDRRPPSVAVGTDPRSGRTRRPLDSAAPLDACPDRLAVLTAPFVSLFTRRDDLARIYASILVSGGHESSLFSVLATRLTEEFRTVITERGCTSPSEAAAKAGALYFAYVGLLFTASARRATDPAALSIDLRGAFAAICTCKELP